MFKKRTLFVVVVVVVVFLVKGICLKEPYVSNEDKREMEEEKTLNAFIMQATTDESGIWQGWGADKLYDDLQIRINFAPTGSDVEFKFQQYLVSGQLPDLIGIKGLTQAKLAMDADILLPLDTYQDQLPNIFNSEYYKYAVDYSKKYTSNGRGHLFIMPVSVGPTAYNAFNWIPMLQWDAYKQAGMPDVNTLEDYLDVVEKMVEIKPVAENGEKVYGFSLFSDWDNVTALEIATLSFMYGIDTEYVSQLMETNVVTKEINSILDEESFYYRALRFYYEANQRNLLDPNSVTQTYSDVLKKFSDGRVMFSWFSWLVGEYNSDNRVNNPEKVDGMASVVAKDMKLYNAPEQSVGRTWYFAISKNSNDIEGALELLNWLYDPHVQQFLCNGPQGVTWQYTEQGEPQIIDWNIVDRKTERLMPNEVGGGAFQDGVFSFNSLGLQAATMMDNGYTLSHRYWPSTLNRHPTRMKDEVNAMLGGVSVLAEYLEPRDMIAYSTQAVNMIGTPSDDMKLTMSHIGEVVKKYSWEMVYAKDEETFEALWHALRTEAKILGIDEVTAFYEQEWKNALELVDDYEK